MSGAAAKNLEHATPPVPAPWHPILGSELELPYFRELQRFVDDDRNLHTVFPPARDVYNALAYTAPDATRVVILGQDPYHDFGQAHGLSFSVPPGIRKPPSLVNIFKELSSDLGAAIPENGCLIPWAVQGVLLLNTVLTVRVHEPGSHRKRGWERFTDAIVRSVVLQPDPKIFVLWGSHAAKKRALIDEARHSVVQAPHPSPLSARNGFFGSRPFSTINDILHRYGSSPIDWRI